MARLIIFLAFLCGLVTVMNMTDFKKVKVNNRPFDFEKTKQANMAMKKAIQKSLHPHEEKKEVKKDVKPEGPLVVLDTEQLKKGAALYAKCVVCHGKRGQGKKSQAAPAIGGQFDWYIESQIVNMKNGTRVNKIMNPYIKKLSEQDIKDLSAYIAKLPHMGK
jgi:cytochrome c553